MRPTGTREPTLLPVAACVLLLAAAPFGAAGPFGADGAAGAAGWFGLPVAGWAGGALSAQVVEDPPPPPADTLPAAAGDTLDVGADTLLLEEQHPPPRHLAELPRPVPAVGMATGVWEWDREGLMATRALSLTDFLARIPGVIRHRGGDYGFPSAVSAFGAGGGRVRIFHDGFEIAPLEGGSIDLSRVGLGGLERVRVERHPGELRVDLYSLTISDPRPYTFIHVATGDLGTNLLRGFFQHPRILGGSLAAGIERLDTEGVNRQEPGSSSSGWFRYSYVPSERWGVGFEYRRGGSERDETLYPPGDVSRTDWVLRGRVRLAEGVVAELFRGSASMESETLERVADPDADPVEPGFAFTGRSQTGLRLRAERNALENFTWWGEGSVRLNGGDGWAENVSDVRAGLRGPRVGGIEAGWEREGWAGGEVASGIRLRAWSPSLFGFSLFGSWEDGRRGMPLPAVSGPSAVLPDPLFTERSATRVGASFDRGGFSLGGAWIRMKADSLAPLGFAAERPGSSVSEGERPRDGLVRAGGERTGVEVSGTVPLLVLDGLALAGSAQLWDDSDVWRYVPRTVYDARLTFHDVFLPTENLEVWADVGLRGRDPMAVPFPGDGGAGLETDLAVVPFERSWFLRLQIRVVTVRVFVDWENLWRRQENQDYPGRLMPATRTTYGVRWSLWN